MAYRVLIPTPLRPYTDQQDAVEVEGTTVGELLASLTARYGDLRKHLYSEEGKLRSFVNVYLNDDDIRYLEREATKLKAGDVLSIVPSRNGLSLAKTSTETLPDRTSGSRRCSTLKIARRKMWLRPWSFP